MERFGQLLFEAVDTTMRQVLGDSASELIYRLIERHVSLKREDVGEKIDVFYTYLEKLLGSEQVLVIQSVSLKRLSLRLRREYEEVERYFWVLDTLYEIKFKFLPSSFKGCESSVCN